MNQKGLTPILIVILVAVLALGGYLVYTNYLNNQTETTPSPAIQPKSSPNPSDVTHESTTSAETANWSVYKSSYGYNIKYPGHAELLDCRGRCNYDAQIKAPGLLLTLVPSGLPLKKDLKDHLNYGFCHPGEATYTEDVNNITFYRSERIFNATNTCLNAVVDLQRKTDYSYWILDLQATAYAQGGIKLYKQILSTFKFTQ